MPVLKFWDGTQWQRVGGRAAGSNFVPSTGGTVKNDLSVATGVPWDIQVSVGGTMRSGPISTSPGGKFDGNIAFTTGKAIDLGGARAQRVGEPTAATSVATKRYVDRWLDAKPRLVPAVLGTGWEVYGGPWSRPGYRLNGGGTFCTLQGLVRAKATIVPGTASQVIFTLPVGYRPSEQSVFMVIGGPNSMMTLNVFPDGKVQLFHGPQLSDGNYVSLDGCRFMVA